MILPCLFIAQTDDMGNGVFTSENIDADTVVEVAPVIVMNRDERKLLDKTRLHDYIFEWGHDKQQCAMALGYISVYNHSYKSNCEYEMDFDESTILVKTMRFIQSGRSFSSTIMETGTMQSLYGLMRSRNV